MTDLELKNSCAESFSIILNNNKEWAEAFLAYINAAAKLSIKNEKEIVN